MASIIELASQIVSSHASSTPMTKDELIAELEDVHASLIALEKGESPTPVDVEATEEEERWLHLIEHSSMVKAFKSTLVSRHS